MATYTIFCEDAFYSTTTIWIDSVEANDAAEAVEVGRQACARDWECEPGDVVVIGVARGDVQFVAFDESGIGAGSIAPGTM